MMKSWRWCLIFLLPLEEGDGEVSTREQLSEGQITSNQRQELRADRYIIRDRLSAYKSKFNFPRDILGCF